VDKVDLGGRMYPVAADFSAPLASYGRINESRVRFLQMIRGERMRVRDSLVKRALLFRANPADPSVRLSTLGRKATRPIKNFS